MRRDVIIKCFIHILGNMEMENIIMGKGCNWNIIKWGRDVIGSAYNKDDFVV